MFAPTTFDVMQVRVAFTGSGGGDLFSMNGRADISNIPEPTSALFCGVGLIGLALLARRRVA
jgi:hypothetical protein